MECYAWFTYMQTINLLATVIFTPLVTLEQRNYGVYTSMHAHDYQLTFNYILVTINLNCSKSKSANFKPPQLASNRKNAKF